MPTIVRLPDLLPELGMPAEWRSANDDGLSAVPPEDIEGAAYVPDDADAPATLGYVLPDGRFVPDSQMLDLAGDDDGIGDGDDGIGYWAADDGIGVSRGFRRRMLRRLRKGSVQVARAAGKVARVLGRSVVSAMLPGAGGAIWDAAERVGRAASRAVVQSRRRNRQPVPRTREEMPVVRTVDVRPAPLVFPRADESSANESPAYDRVRQDEDSVDDGNNQIVPPADDDGTAGAGDWWR